MKLMREKSHRLPKEVYQGRDPVAFTVCIKDRATPFAREDIVHIFEQILLSESERFNCDILAYVFMPDHCHILLQGKVESAQPLDAIRMFKQKTGFWLSKNLPDVHWQKDFYDHILRKEEDIRKHVQYILENPVRKNLVDDWQKYKFKGSTVYNFNEW